MQSRDLMREAYKYELPEELIADRPVKGRHNSKLLVYYQKSDRVEHRHFYELPEIFPKDHLLVLNQSKVFPCRLLGKKKTGGKCEIFLLSLMPENGLYPTLVKTTGRKHPGDVFSFGELSAEIVEILGDGTFLVRFNKTHNELLEALEEVAQIPIPPYIREGLADEQDKQDYQTVYAKEVGSVAAPTAGLHFTQDVFKGLAEKGIEKAFVTLHVGVGTFKPVKTDSILDHQMHEEHFDIEAENLALLNRYEKKIAVGTTTLRVLESCYNEGKTIVPEKKSTDIFLYPGKEVNSIRGLITNFHLPESTLLMLVSSIIGREKALELYKMAIEKEYRFFSYGDAMLILRDF